MNKVVKLISILLITLMLVIAFSNVAFAGDSKTVITDLNGASYNSDKAGDAKSIAKDILSVIRTVAVIVTIIMISVLGIRFMIGSAEERANYKKTFIPLIVGAVLVVAAAQIATMLFSISVS